MAETLLCHTGIILGMSSANEICYILMLSLIGWVHTDTHGYQSIIPTNNGKDLWYNMATLQHNDSRKSAQWRFMKLFDDIIDSRYITVQCKMTLHLAQQKHTLKPSVEKIQPISIIKASYWMSLSNPLGNDVHKIWGLCYQKQVSQAGISNYIPQFTVGCNYLSLPEMPASGNKVLI